MEPQLDEQAELERTIREKHEPLRAAFTEWVRQTGEPSSTFDDFVQMRVEHARANYQKDRAHSEMADFLVRWDKIGSDDCAQLEALLETGPREEPMHQLLNSNPKFLVQALTGGHGRYQLSKQQLGCDFVSDFLIADESSIGVEWYLVEIESPRHKVQKNNGEPLAAVNHAVTQIRDWRAWLTNNLNYARGPKQDHGLGLTGIDGNAPGLIIIGRREEYLPRYNDFRRQLRDRERIVIHSYDWLVEVARSNRSSWLTLELQQNGDD